jgi:Tubulin binding cofactor C
VNVIHTSLDVYHPVVGAIHVTECQEVTFMDGIQAQQLRLHHSKDIHCYNSHIHAGTILEDCQHVTFHVPSTTNPAEYRNNIKDFNWLRNGIPSPNFSIQIFDPTSTTTTTTSTTMLHGTTGTPAVRNDPSIDPPSIELPDPSTHNNILEENDDSDDDEI